MDWYALLGEKDFKQNRDKAIEFIRGVAEDVHNWWKSEDLWRTFYKKDESLRKEKVSTNKKTMNYSGTV